MGDEQRLIALEARFAAEPEQGPGVFSPHDKNHHAPWNWGGDKMRVNGYGPFYSWLYGRVAPGTVVELGVFRGVSLAVWDALWPGVRLLGLDVDLARYEANLDALRASGGFPDGLPQTRIWDAYQPDTAVILDTVGRPDLFIDDGPHTEDAIRLVLDAVGPLVERCYVIEDFPGGAALLRQAFPGWEVRDDGRIAGALRVP